MAPISMVFLITGFAVFVQSFFFLGIGAKGDEGKKSPIVPVGVAALVAGIVDLAIAFYMTVGRPIGDDPSLHLSGLVGIYGLFFVVLGLAEIYDLDLKIVGNLAIPTAIVPLAWMNFFAGSATFTVILLWWVVAFASIALTTYGKMQAKVLGIVLLITAVLTFMAVPVANVLEITLP